MKRLLAIAVTFVLVIAVGVVVLVRSYSATSAVAPFTKLPATAPRLIPMKENLSEEELKEWRRYVQEGGVIAQTTPAEREAFQATYQNQYVRGRELAEKVLREQPNSLAARFALARAVFHGEGDYPRALYQFRKLRQRLEAAGRANPDDADAREWYIRVLREELDVLKAMDRSDEQLETLALLEQVYGELPWLKTWSLFKLQRLEEAAQSIAAAEQSGEWKERALNYQLVLAHQRRQRAEAYKAGQAMVRVRDKSPVAWHNFGGAAFADFRFDEAEKAWLESAKHPLDYYGAPHLPLVTFYAQQGRFKESVEAYRTMQRQRGLRSYHTMAFDQPDATRSLALLLLALGQGEEAERFARRTVAAPHRAGHSSETEEEAAFANDLLLWTVLQTRRQQAAEMAAFTDLGTQRLFDTSAAEFESWTLRRRLQAALSEANRPNAFRPYLPGAAPLEGWMLGNLPRVLPTGVALELLRRAREEEAHPAAVPYFDAVEAETLLLAGRSREALDRAKAALEKLPPREEKLLRGRTAVVAAEAAHRLALEDESRRFFEQTLADFPGALRLVEVALPVRVEDDGSNSARQVKQHLMRSPRFRADANGSVLRVNAAKGGVEFTLVRLNGDVQVKDTVASEDVRAVVERIHQRLLAPAVWLSAVEINALDVSPIAVRNRDTLDRVLDVSRPR